VWAALMDEGNFFAKQKRGHQSAGGGKEDKSEGIYDSLRRRIRGTYSARGLHGRLIMISSKKSIYDFTERRLREAMKESDDSVFCRDYCLASDTKIPLLDGTTPTIKELTEKYSGSDARFWVYSIDPASGLIVPGAAHHPHLTKKGEPVFKVTLDNGEWVRVTGNHPFMLRSGDYRKAEDLKPGDSLMALYLQSRTLTKQSSRKVSPGNHTVITVEPDGVDDVYDLSVEQYENFAIDAGVFVHNSTWDVRPDAFVGQKWWRAAVSQKIGRVRVLDDDEEPEEHEIWFKFPDEYYKEFINDPAGAARDIAGIALESFRPFFSNREAINDMQKPERAHPFHVYEWVTSRQITPIWENVTMNNVHGDPVPRCCPNAHRHAHMDLSKNRDATGICVGHVAGETEVSRLNPMTHERVKENAPIIHIDLCLRVMAPHAGEIEHELIRGLIYQLREGGLPIRSVSADRWMGLPNLQLISRHGFKTEEISTQRTLDPYLAAQSALYERRIETPVYPFLAKELRELELNDAGTKVDHPKTGCFAGDTKVRLLDGRALTFEDLVAEYGEGGKFHTYTMRDGAVSVGVGYAPRLTASDAPVVAVQLDNGEVVRCTPDHRFMLRDGGYREAQDLRPGDSLMPLYTKRSTMSSHKMKGYELYLCPGDGRWHYTHRMVGKWKYPGYTGNQHGTGLIHHDQGKLNNDPDALILCADAKEHGLLHRKDILEKRADPVFEAKRLAGLESYNNNPENRERAARRFSKTMRRPDVRKKMQKVWSKTGKVTGPRNLTAYNKSEAHKKKASEIGKKTIHKAIAARRRIDVTIEKVVELHQSGLSTKEIAEHFDCSPDIIRGRLKKGGVVLSPRSEPPKKDITASEIIELREAGLSNVEIAARFGCSKTLVVKRLRTARKAGVRVPRARCGRPPLVNSSAPNNHKVISVTDSGRADVYDISVEETSNFALDAGVFVHNSKDVADAFAATVYYLATHWQHIGIGGVSLGVATLEAGVPGQAYMTSDGDFRWPDEPPLPTEDGEDWSGFPTYIV